ncbi:uncharacterized protein V1516DRAFT_681867 [Lipomyces oligophaga]|uniref:uncharacterized protein n=1 Tax=Lipomyces oligophaga TaxID=45792 RepID=UPI0034CD082A
MATSPQLTTGVRESSEFVYKNADDVSICVSACRDAAQSIFQAMQNQAYSTETWSNHLLNPKTKDESTLHWIFIVDTLNFSFWSDVDQNDTGKADTQRYTVRWLNQDWTGYWSLCAAIDRALAEGFAVTTPSFWKSCSEDKIRHIFRSETRESIPMFTERVDCLKQVSSVLLDSYSGSFANCILQADGSAVKLVQLIVSAFPCFRDQSIYKTRDIKIYKRAQILVSDIWACFNGSSFGTFYDIDEITMFADYRVPQILHSLGCLVYSPELQQLLKNLQPLQHGDNREVELRACSIWAVELIRQQIQSQHPDSKINSILIDFYLWDTAKQIQASMGDNQESIPCHRTRSIFY